MGRRRREGEAVERPDGLTEIRTTAIVTSVQRGRQKPWRPALVTLNIHDECAIELLRRMDTREFTGAIYAVVFIGGPIPNLRTGGRRGE